MGAPLDMACRSSLLLRSAQTLSTTLLRFEFLQRPQHVLSNLPDQPHASVWTGSSTIAFSSAFPLALSLALSTFTTLCLPIGNLMLLGLPVGMGGEVGLLVLLKYLAMPVVMCMVVPLAVADPATGVLRSVLAERDRRVPDPPGFSAVLGPGVQAVPPGPVLPILLHVVRYEREEVGFFMILWGGRRPEILAASTPFLRGADRVPLDLSLVAIFSMTSMSWALSILHVGLVLGVELQMYFTISSRLMRAKMTCILSGSPRLHSTLLGRISLCPMVSPNTST